MSHLEHKVTVSKDLLSKGIANPLVHEAVARGAYVRAFATFEARGRIQQARYLGEFFNRMLGYWNEKSPIQGNLIIAELTSFNGSVKKQLLDLGGVDGVHADFIKPDGIPADLSVSSLDGFKGMVDSLLADCEKNLAEWIKEGSMPKSTQEV